MKQDKVDYWIFRNLLKVIIDSLIVLLNLLRPKEPVKPKPNKPNKPIIPLPEKPWFPWIRKHIDTVINTNSKKD